MQALVAAACRGRVPDDHVIRPISCCHPGRASSVLTLAPGKHDRWWICCSDSVGPDGTGIIVETNKRSLTGMISDSGCSSVDPPDIRLVRGPGNTAEIVAVQQISIAIFTQGKHKLRRGSTRHVNHRGADAAKIGIAVVKTEPVARRPVVGGLTRPCRSRLQTDNGFAAHPIASRIEGVPCDDKHVRAITGHAAMSPNAAADSRCSPAMHVGRVIDVHADNPPMIIAAIPQVARVLRVYDPIHKGEATPLFLRQRNKRYAVVNNSGIQVHRPTRSRGAGVHVQRINPMFIG